MIINTFSLGNDLEDVNNLDGFMDEDITILTEIKNSTSEKTTKLVNSEVQALCLAFGDYKSPKDGKIPALEIKSENIYY